ncbi:MAG: hypothetical protein V4466_05500 [Pseudomonadota bacterium]
MPSLFPSPAIEVLSADGTYVSLDGRASAGGRPLALAPRELCAFEHHDPGLKSRSAALAAAHARAGQASPFLNAGALVRRQPGGFAIWWWDLDALDRPLRERFGTAWPRILPASLGQPPGAGWRIVRLETGYEAQLWRDGALRASTWRREPFDAQAWSAFARVQREADAPTTPPPALPLPLVSSRLTAALTHDLTPQQAAALAVGCLAALMLLSSVFFLGQGLRLGRQTKAVAAEAALVAMPTPTAGGADVQRLTAWRALSGRPDVITALARAIGVAELYGAAPTAWSADASQVSLTIPYSAISSLSRIAVELKDTGLFSEIRPVTDTERGVIELRLALVGGAPLSPDE